MLDGLPEFRIATVFAADLLERALALRGVELAAAETAFAALIALPQLRGGVVVDHARDVDRERFQRADGIAAAFAGRRDRRCVVAVARGAGQQIAEPAAAGGAAAVGGLLAALDR